MKQESPFSFAALARIVAMGLMIYLAWKGLTVLIVLLIAVIISMALTPIAEKFNKKMPWWAAVLSVVLLLLIPIILVAVFTAIAFSNQFPQVVVSINQLIDGLSFIPESFKSINILETIQGNAGYVLDSTKTVIGVIGSIVTVIVAVFYLIYDRKALTEIILGVLSPKNKEMTSSMFQEISLVVGHYIRGNLIVSAVCTVIIFLGLTILGVPFALPLAIFTGIMDLLPYVGPLIALIPAAILGLAHGPVTGLLVIIFYLVYQQIENTFIVPMVYNKALNLSPALVFLSVVIGAGMFGILGAFLALPVAASIPVLIKYTEKMQKSRLSQKTKTIAK
ncbi:MAG: AI-2E family transporter [bacterium]